MSLPLNLGRVSLRRLRAEDLRDFQAYRQDPEVARYQGWSAQGDEQALAFLNEMAVAPALLPGVWFQIGIAAAGSDRLLGDIGVRVHEDGQRAEIGFSLARAAQGQGLAREAVQGLLTELLFARPGLSQVQGITDARNRASLALLQRLGFVEQERWHTEFKGEPCVEIGLLLTRR